MAHVRISGKNLGAFALPDFCPRCGWLKLRMSHKMPYQIFPGIFSSIDSYTKHVVHGHFDAHGRAPIWLDGLGPLAGYRPPPHYSKFSIEVPEFDITLWGSPDAVFVRTDKSFLIADYKTAKFTGHQDELFPIYETQLNALSSSVVPSLVA